MVGVTTELICNWVITIIKLVIWKVVFFLATTDTHTGYYLIICMKLNLQQFSVCLWSKDPGGEVKKKKTRGGISWWWLKGGFVLIDL